MFIIPFINYLLKKIAKQITNKYKVTKVERTMEESKAGKRNRSELVWVMRGIGDRFQ